MKVLAVGSNGTKELAASMFDGQVDTAAIRPQKRQKDYDALLSYMVLPRIPFRKVGGVVKSWVEAVKEGGEIIIFAPSLEWAAYQVLMPEHSPALVHHMFGSQRDSTEFYCCGFTMMDLRSLCSKAGIAVTHAQTGEYQIGEYACECHIVRGVKK